MNKDFREKIENIVNDELQSAKEKFPPIHSSLEGWAILEEEVSETEEELESIKKNQSKLFENIRRKNIHMQYNILQDYYDDAINMIQESIQVAAMVKRYLEDIDFSIKNKE